MINNKLFTAITLALGSSPLLLATQQVSAGDVVAMQMDRPVQLPSGSAAGLANVETDDKRLLAHGMARLSSADSPSDFRVALRYFQRAAHLGNTEAQFQLAIMQLDNPHVEQDEEAAIRWLRQASDNGHRQAAVALDYVVNSGGDIGC